jgi:hypothetical protein
MMKKILALAIVVYGIIGCQQEENSSTNSIVKIDSISSFSIISDTIIVDANYSPSNFPKAVAHGDSLIEVENMVQVSCGYEKFQLSKNKDTVVVSAVSANNATCVDWTAAFYYHAKIYFVGKCNFVKFTASGSLIKKYSDTTLKL